MNFYLAWIQFGKDEKLFSLGSENMFKGVCVELR